MPILTRLFLVLSVLLFALPAAAETRYVSDQLVVNLRREAALSSETIRGLKTATPVEVLRAEGKFLKVRTAEGEEGYVHQQYLSRKTPKSLVIARLEKERDGLKVRVAELVAELTSLATKVEEASTAGEGKEEEMQERSSMVEAEIARKAAELKSLTEKYEALLSASKHVVDVVNERDRLRDDYERLLGEVETLRDENALMMRNGMIRWFLAGGGVLFVGWVAGKLSRKKRSRF